MNREDIAKLSSKERRKVLKNQICEICLEKPARNILPSSNILCCCDRGNRCLNPKTEQLVCFSCGQPATKIMKPGPVCGRHSKGCPEFVKEYQIRKGQTYKQHLEDNSEFRRERKEKYFKTLKEKHGVDSIFQLESFKQKMLNKYGVENSSQSPEIRAKMIENSLEKWGTTHPLANPEQREKLKKIFLERYGVENPAQSKELREKNEKAYTEKYGVHHPMMRPENKKIQKEAIKKKYGVGSVSYIPGVKEKFKKTMTEKYGVDNPAFLPGFYRYKEMILPSGKKILYQGYEGMMINKYLEVYGEESLEFNIDNKYKFYYINPNRNNKKSYYRPDLYIKRTNTMIEVKSVFTLIKGINDRTLILKTKSVLGSGYNLQIEVWEPNRIHFIIDLSKLLNYENIDTRLKYKDLEILLS